MQSQFLSEFESLNISLLKYIPEHPDAKWCTLPALLQEYGVFLPQKLREMISQYVRFPGEASHRNWEPPTHPVPPSTSGQFQPGHEISLQLAKNVDFYQLAELIVELNIFQEPLLAHLQMLVFFKLNKSVMFDKYLRAQIGYNTEKLQQLKPQSLLPPPQFSSFSFSVPVPSLLLPIQCEDGGGEEGLPIKIFVQSLKETEQFLIKAMKGDINLTIKDAFDVQSLDIAKETSLLAQYSDMYHLDCSGISGAQRILQLCQWMDCLQAIQIFGYKYQLKNCTQDPKLIQLVSITDGLISGEVTQDEAERILKRIKEVLISITNIDDTNYLKLFRAIGDSGSTYQKLQDMCVLQRHRAVFQQLQHDTVVVSDLPTGISLLSIFDDKEQDLTSLFSRVFEFSNVQECIQILKNINSNLPLVTQLFSDEVSSLLL